MRLDQIIVVLLAIGAVVLILYLHRQGKSGKNNTKST
jgi:hypothetical protein